MKNSKILNVQQLIDATINYAECSINFKLLHTLLHVMANQLRLDGTVIEVQSCCGHDGDDIMCLCAACPPSIKIDEFVVSSSSCGSDTMKRKVKKPSTHKVRKVVVVRKNNCVPLECKLCKDVKFDDQLECCNQTEITTVEPLNTCCQALSCTAKMDPPRILTRSLSQTCCPPPTSYFQSAYCCNSTPCSPCRKPCTPCRKVTPCFTSPCCSPPSNCCCGTLSLVNKAEFRKLEDKVECLYDTVNGALPCGTEIFEAYQKGNCTCDPVRDFWNCIHFKSRVDTVEMNIDKLKSLFNDLLRRHGELCVRVERIDKIKECESVRHRLDCLEQCLCEKVNDICTPPECKFSLGNYKCCPAPEFDICNQQSITADEWNKYKQTVDQCKTLVYNVAIKTGALREPETSCDETERTSGGGSSTSFYEKKCCPNIRNLCVPRITVTPPRNDCILTRKIELLESRLHTIENEVCDVLKELSHISERVDDTLQQIKCRNTACCQHVGWTAELRCEVNSLKNDVADHECKIKEAIDNIEWLKENDSAIQNELVQMDKKKADSSDVDGAMTKKQTFEELDKKASYEHLELVRKDILATISSLGAKFSMFESAVKSQFEVIRTDMCTKLDKCEIETFRASICARLDHMTERIRCLSAVTRDCERDTGGKNKLFKHLDCLSCKKACFAKDECGLPKVARGMIPPNKTLKPFLNCELDTVRRELKHFPTCKTIHHVEKPLTLNRLCGGSRSALPPAKPTTRVARCIKKQYQDPSNDSFYMIGTDNVPYRMSKPEHRDSNVSVEERRLNYETDCSGNKLC